MFIHEEKNNPQLESLNEIFIQNHSTLDPEVTNSIYYAKLKHLLHQEIISFCKEQTELKADLNFFRMSVGETINDREIAAYLDSLKEKYSNVENVGLEYHIEATRIDYGVVVFCMIKRRDLHVKKFVFRFRKTSSTDSLFDISTGGIPKEDEAQNRITKLLGGEK